MAVGGIYRFEEGYFLGRGGCTCQGMVLEQFHWLQFGNLGLASIRSIRFCILLLSTVGQKVLILSDKFRGCFFEGNCATLLL